MKVSFKIFIGGTLFALLLWKANPQAVVSSLVAVPLDTVALSSGIFCLTWFMITYKWYVLLPSSKYTELFSLSLVGHFYSSIFPGQIAGEVVKAFHIGKGRKNAEQLAMSVLVDKMTGLIGLLCVTTVGLLFSRSLIPQEISVSVFLLTVLFLSALWAVRLSIIFSTIDSLIVKTSARWPERKRLFKRIRKFLEGWRFYVLRPWQLGCAILLGAAIQTVWVGMTMLLARGLGIELQFSDWCWVFGVVSVAVMIPISIGGIGVREGAFVGALSLHGVSIELSITLSLLGFAISLLSVAAGGVLEIHRCYSHST